MKITRREIGTILCALLALALSPLLYYIFIFAHLPPKFSVQLADIQRLDSTTAVMAAAPLTTFFNISLHASNKRSGNAACYRHGEAVVRYSGFALACGRTRAFCVGAKEARDLRVVAWADGVGLPDLIHDRMVAERRAGMVELEVNVKLFAQDDESGAQPTWMWCKVKVVTGREERSAMTPCSVFGSMIWGSDFAPNWMLT